MPEGSGGTLPLLPPSRLESNRKRKISNDVVTDHSSRVVARWRRRILWAYPLGPGWWSGHRARHYPHHPAHCLPAWVHSLTDAAFYRHFGEHVACVITSSCDQRALP